MMQESKNFDPDEIRKFNFGSDVWWDPNGEFKALHVINPLRIQYLANKVDLSDKIIVDVGCGGGIFAEGLAVMAQHVTGIDLNQEAINAARDHNSHANLDYICIDTSEHARALPSHYDAVTCMELLEHVPDPKALIEACKDLVKPGGQLFFSTINRNFTAYVKLILIGEHAMKLLPKGTHDYSKFIKPSEMIRWCRQNGLVVADITGLEFSPVTRRYYLSETPGANYFLHAIKSED